MRIETGRIGVHRARRARRSTRRKGRKPYVLQAKHMAKGIRRIRGAGRKRPSTVGGGEYSYTPGYPISNTRFRSEFGGRPFPPKPKHKRTVGVIPGHSRGSTFINQHIRRVNPKRRIRRNPSMFNMTSVKSVGRIALGAGGGLLAAEGVGALLNRTGQQQGIGWLQNKWFHAAVKGGAMMVLAKQRVLPRDKANVMAGIGASAITDLYGELAGKANASALVFNDMGALVTSGFQATPGY